MKYLVLLSALLLNTVVNAGEVVACESASSGSWDQAATWINCNGGYPDSGSKSATIKTGHIIDFDLDSVTVYGLLMEASSELNIGNTFPAVNMIIANDGFNSSAGHVFVQANSLTINAQLFDISLGQLDGATELVLNTSGTTFLFDNIGQSTPLVSLTTDAAGTIRTQGQTFLINLDGSQDTQINDDYNVGPSSRSFWSQAGTGNIVFNGYVKQLSGSPQQLTVNLNGGGDVVFNDIVRLGRLNTTGSGNTIINTDSVTTVDAGANPGDMIFDNPVLIATDVTFATENTTSDIFFNASLDDDGDVGTTSFVTINTPNTVKFSDVGQNSALNGLDVISASAVNLYDDITTTDVLSFNAPVVQHNDVTFTNTIVLASFAQGLNAQNNNTNFNFGATLDLNSYGANLSQISTLTLGPLGQTEMSGGVFDASTNLIIDNTATTPGDAFTVTGAATIDLASLTIHNDLNLSANLNLIVSDNSQLLGSTTPPGSGSITKSGDGTLSIPSGNFWGTLSSLEVTDGVLQTDALHIHGFTVSQTGVLTGTGSIELNTLNLNDAAILSPGSGENDLQNFSVEGLNMTPNSTLEIELSGSPNLGSDRVSINGAVAFLDGNLSLLNTQSTKAGDVFTILQNPGGIPFAGAFVGMPEGTEVSPGLFISYVGGDGNDVTLSATCDAQIVVFDPIDSGPGSLRQAVADVCDGGEVIIDSNTADIILSTAITIDKTLTIQGNNRVVSGDDSTQIFNVNSLGALTLSNVLIMNASAGTGAIDNSGELIVQNSYFANNFSSGGGGLGGGAILNRNTTTIENSVFVQNNAFRGGALFNASEAVMTVNNSTFYQNGNSLSAEGGVIHNRGAVTMNHVTMADSGDGDVSFGNSISMFGAGATFDLINSVIAGSATPTECSINSNTTITLTNSFIHDGSCGATLSGDAKLDVLQGSVPSEQHLPPTAGSPLVNAADAANCLASDQLGTSRPQGLACDIGAIEITDIINPEVSLVTIENEPVELCGDMQSTTINTIEITFNERVINAETAGNYFLTYTDLFGFDQDFVPLTAVSDNDSSTPTVTLSFETLALGDGLLQLTLTDIQDEFNNFLNEDVPLRFRIDQGNLLTNGHFDECEGIDINTGWQYSVGSKALAGSPFEPNFSDYHNLDNSGSVLVQDINNSDSYIMQQCIELDSTTLPIYTESQWLFFTFKNAQQGLGSEATITNTCEQFDQAMCMGQSLGQTQITDTLNDQIFSFFEVSGNHGKPQTGALSAQCEWRFEVTQPQNNIMIIDAIRFTQPDLIFEDGFEPPKFFCRDLDGC